MTLELRVPSCPMFFAMTKQLTAVAEPSTTRNGDQLTFTETEVDSNGQKQGTQTDELDKDGTQGRPELTQSFMILKEAPMAMRPSGVAVGHIFYGFLEILP